MSQQTITLTLPWPVSANRYWRSFVPRGHQRAIVTLSDEAKAYKEQVNLLAWQQGVREPIEGRVRVDIALYPHRPLDWAKRARKDPDGWSDSVQCIDLTMPARCSMTHSRAWPSMMTSGSTPMVANAWSPTNTAHAWW